MASYSEKLSVSPDADDERADDERVVNVHVDARSLAADNRRHRRRGSDITDARHRGQRHEKNCEQMFCGFLLRANSETTMIFSAPSGCDDRELSQHRRRQRFSNRASALSPLDRDAERSSRANARKAPPPPKISQNAARRVSSERALKRRLSSGSTRNNVASTQSVSSDVEQLSQRNSKKQRAPSHPHGSILKRDQAAATAVSKRQTSQPKRRSQSQSKSTRTLAKQTSNRATSTSTAAAAAASDGERRLAARERNQANRRFLGVKSMKRTTHGVVISLRINGVAKRFLVPIEIVGAQPKQPFHVEVLSVSLQKGV